MPLSALTLPPHVSNTFNVPQHLIERDDVNIMQLYDWCAVHNPDYPIFAYHDGKQHQFITYATAAVAINRAARFAAARMSASPEAGSTPPVIAVLASADSITYICTLLGFFKAGYTAFAISIRNAPVAITDMLKRSGATDIVVSSDATMLDHADEAISALAREGVRIVQHRMPLHDDLFGEGQNAQSPFEVPRELPELDIKAPAVIMHSSGSTGHPKPIVWTHQSLFLDGWTITQCREHVTGCLMGAHGTPMFHALGALLYSAAPMTGLIIATFKPASPPTVPTPDAVWDGVVISKSDYWFGVPSFLELWARDPEKLPIMASMRGLIYGGARLNDEVGNKLASQGVSIYTVYGCTEVGIINTLIRPNPGMDWAYWCPSPRLRVAFKPVSEGLFEAIVCSTPYRPIPKPNGMEGEFEAYITNDLVVPHPMQPGFWKIITRADDQIILSNGENTNPVPLEKIIDEDPHVKMSIMFGQGKFQNGVLVEPAEGLSVDPNDPQQVAAFRNAIWSTVERANEYAPQHSRVFKEMILVASTSKPFQLTAKATLRRRIILAEYNDEIEALYRAVETSASSDIPPPATWDQEGITTFVRAVVHETLHRPIKDDADIFRNGGDSLQATWIRNTLRRAVAEADAATAQRISPNLVFAFPTISALARAVHEAVHGGDSGARKPEDLWAYVERYSAGFPARPARLVARPPGDGKDVVLITGTTGGFGCDALEHLLRDAGVGRVYAFNRKGSDALKRQRAQFARRGLDGELLDSGKFVMVEAVLHEAGFGIEEGLLEEIRQSVTHIMLNAWTINFNMTIASFEVDMQGVRNFVDLALSSPYTVPPTVIFASSIGIFAKYSGPLPVPEAPLDDPSSPFGSGYCEAKWVLEHVMQNASAQTDVRTVVVRLGQIAGDRLGYWNEKEWFPSIVKSALHQRCLPSLDGVVSWFPAYEASKAFTEMRHSCDPVLHLVHPHPVPWSTIMTPIAEELGVPFATYDAWLAALEAGGADDVGALRANQALRLLPFYRTAKEMMDKDAAHELEPMGLVPLSTAKSTTVSEALKAMPQFDAARAKSWLAAWKKAGFL